MGFRPAKCMCWTSVVCAVRFAVALVASMVLAGCSDAPDSPGGTTTTGPSGSDAPSLPAPNWTVGQWWTLSSDQLAAPFTHVVAQDAGSDWLVGTDNPDVAFFDARSDISFLGPVRKSDLAGSQGQDRVEFFRFPLEQHKNWTTRWDQLDVRIHVLDVNDGRARLESRLANGTLHSSYTYDAALGYFRDYRFFASDGATVSFAATVTTSGTDFKGQVAQWTLDLAYATDGPFVSGEVVSFEVTPAHTDVYIEIDLVCAQGGFTISVLPPTGAIDQRGFSASGPCPAAVSDTGTVPAPMEDEQWTVVTQSIPTATTATLHLVVYVRTLALTTLAPPSS